MFIWAALLKITRKQTSWAANMKNNPLIRYRRQTKPILQSIPECLIWNSGFCHSNCEKCSCYCIDNTTKLTSDVIEGCCCRLNATTWSLAEHHVSCFTFCHSDQTTFTFGWNHRGCDFIIMFTFRCKLALAGASSICCWLDEQKGQSSIFSLCNVSHHSCRDTTLII